MRLWSDIFLISDFEWFNECIDFICMCFFVVNCFFVSMYTIGSQIMFRFSTSVSFSCND